MGAFISTECVCCSCCWRQRVTCWRAGWTRSTGQGSRRTPSSPTCPRSGSRSSTLTWRVCRYWRAPHANCFASVSPESAHCPAFLLLLFSLCFCFVLFHFFLVKVYICAAPIKVTFVSLRAINNNR